jgi:two-component system cell cycle sensor histidine kinase/response regulator CckA
MAGADSSRARILIVDDERSLLKMIKIYLERRGYSVTTCDTTQEAWSLVEQQPQGFAVAVIDATMEGLSMEELAIAMLKHNPDLHVLVASGYPVDMNGLEAAAPRRVEFLHKPFTPHMLAAAVERRIAPQEKEEI